MSDIHNEAEMLAAIAQAAGSEGDWKASLDKMIPLARSGIIFDNLVIYRPGDGESQVETTFARSMGRGRAAEADVSWGELVALDVLSTGKMTMTLPEELTQNRLQRPYVLGMPIRAHQNLLGCIIMVRFGGPDFTETDVHIASFLATEIGRLFERQVFLERIQTLEATAQQARLQDDFISTISHELLTPLGFIKGYATTLLRSDTSWDEATRQEFLVIIDQETDRLQELIDNLLDSARLQSGMMRMDIQPVRMDLMLRDVMMRAQAQNRGLRVILQNDPTANLVLGDPRRLSQVFENLVGNAVKYAPDSTIDIHSWLEEGNIHVTVRDHGQGIPPQYLARLFQRFFRNPEQSSGVRGTGLGLFICRQIIQAHRGMIWIESQVGEGTTVHVLFPGN